MTPAEQLDALYAEQKVIEEKIRAIYSASIDAPADEKVCDDAMANLLGAPDLFKLIEYPITVSGITATDREPVQTRRKSTGKFVVVRPCEEGLDKKSFLGIYLGDIARNATVVFNPATGVLELGLAGHNPAIFVPDLGRIVWGFESWWGVIEHPDQMKQITDADIENVWYVKALRQAQQGIEPPAADAVAVDIEKTSGSMG